MKSKGYSIVSKSIRHYKQNTLLPVASSKIKSVYLAYNDSIRKYGRDIQNRIIYGHNAPVFADRIWISPTDCTEAIESEAVSQAFHYLHPRNASGGVIDFLWPFERKVQIMKVKKIKCCVEHWVNGVPWEHTGIYDYMEMLLLKKGSVDGCKNMNDVIERYKNLDALFEEVKKEGRLKTRTEINPKAYREHGGILIHIGPNGKPYFGMGGAHRFAIAQILGIVMPAQLGIIHKSAIPLLPNLRQRKEPSTNAI